MHVAAIALCGEEASMRTLAIITGIGLVTFAGLAAAQAQPNLIQGTPSLLFPYAAPNEVQIINGVPCRTVLVEGSNVRVPVECAR
jgi:preprotein translocase subunit SecB